MTEKEFFAELAENDKLCNEEKGKKTYLQKNIEFADFIAKNNVKIKGGKKDE